MENRYLKNKIIIRYCSDYYKIINQKFSTLDVMSDKIIHIYQAYIFSINPKNKIDLKRSVELSKSISKYFEDREFKKILSNDLKSLKAPKGIDVLKFIVDNIISAHKKYLEGYTRNLYVPRWI